ncbi:MAG: rubrerythrin family protein [Candidatus Riflebacteria bacterium]|nr:rubrerythrin family protein [Candidatus Riflebacteria bacterium]
MKRFYFVMFFFFVLLCGNIWGQTSSSTSSGEAVAAPTSSNTSVATTVLEIEPEATQTLASATPAAPIEELKVGTTLENLKAALNGESNAKMRYKAFAEKADEEKYLQVARLFRVIARAEELHALHHAKIIEKMGASFSVDIKLPEVKSTRENLETALRDEKFEMERMYPAFAQKAEEEKQEFAMKTFKGAQAGEVQHAKFYTEALSNLENMKELKTDYLICTVCGYITIDLGIQKCPVCSSPRSKFESIK